MTLNEQLRGLLRVMRRRSNYRSSSIVEGKKWAQIAFLNPTNASAVESRACEWGRVMDVARLFQNTPGGAGRPAKFGFIADGVPCDESRQYFSNAKIRGMQHSTSLVVEKAALSTLARPACFGLEAFLRRPLQAPSVREGTLLTPLRAVLVPYLSRGRQHQGWSDCRQKSHHVDRSDPKLGRSACSEGQLHTTGGITRWSGPRSHGPASRVRSVGQAPFRGTGIRRTGSHSNKRPPAVSS